MNTLEQEQTLTLIRSFCGDDETRFVFMNPFNFEGSTIATDGRIMVWIPQIDIPENKGTPIKNLKIVMDVWKDGPWETIESLPEAKFEDCEWCKGQGNCVKCDCGSDHKCGECDGSGKFEINQEVVIGNRLLGSVFLSKMVKLPGLLIAPTQGGVMDPMSFKFDGDGKGLIMPRRPE